MVTNHENFGARPADFSLRTVAVVARDPETCVLDAVLDAGHYDIVFIESLDHAFSRIKKSTPHLVIVCLEMDDALGFQVLSMLQLDRDTSRIPVLTYVNELNAAIDDGGAVDPEQFARPEQISVSMN